MGIMRGFLVEQEVDPWQMANEWMVWAKSQRLSRRMSGRAKRTERAVAFTEWEKEF